MAVLGAGAIAAVLVWAWGPAEQYQPISANDSGAIPKVFASAPSGFAAEQPAFGPDSSEAAAPSGPRSEAAPEAPTDNPSPESPIDRTVGGSPQAPAPAAGADSGQSSGWPFPFDRPAAPRPGDNRATAVNTQDNTSVSDLVASLAVVGEGPADQANEAFAAASCRDCSAIAVAFQVVLIVGSVHEITSVNSAVAINYDCNNCITAAFAYQIVATLLAAPSDSLLEQLSIVLQRVNQLQAILGTLTPEQIHLLLEEIQRDVLGTLAGALALQPGTSVGDLGNGGGSAGTGTDPANPEPGTQPAPGSSGSDGSATAPPAQEPAPQSPPADCAPPAPDGSATPPPDGSTTTAAPPAGSPACP
jgi:putative peptide zinc metalloprotease protein